MGSKQQGSLEPFRICRLLPALLMGFNYGVLQVVSVYRGPGRRTARRVKSQRKSPREQEVMLLLRACTNHARSGWVLPKCLSARSFVCAGCLFA